MFTNTSIQSMPKQAIAKNCEQCQTPVTIRYRIQYDQSGKWYLVCPECWKQLSENNPHYRYGGTWKAK